MYKFHPSSAAFMVGDGVLTQYNNGCLRSILIKANGIKDGDISDISKACGAASEEQHERDLEAMGVRFEREISIKRQLSPAVMYSGRVDFLGSDNETPLWIDECKGHTSTNSRREIIRKGVYSTGHLAQLVSYMVKMKVNAGRIVCGYFEQEESGSLKRQEGRVFNVRISEEGDIFVDKEPTLFSVDSLLEHEAMSVHVIEHGVVVSDRPLGAFDKYKGPCTRCSFKAACDSYDQNPVPTAQFLSMAQDAVWALPPKKGTKVNAVKKHRTRKPK